MDPVAAIERVRSLRLQIQAGDLDMVADLLDVYLGMSAWTGARPAGFTAATQAARECLRANITELDHGDRKLVIREAR